MGVINRHTTGDVFILELGVFGGSILGVDRKPTSYFCVYIYICTLPGLISLVPILFPSNPTQEY